MSILHVFFFSCILAGNIFAEERLPLITVEGSFENSQLVGLTSDGEFMFRLEDESEMTVPRKKMVRFGSSLDPDPDKVWLLSDNGSLFVGTLEDYKKNELFVSKHPFSKDLNERSTGNIAAIILRPPVDPLLGDQWQEKGISFNADQKFQKPTEVDFLLSNGDNFQGRLLEFSPKEAICELEDRKMILPNGRIRMMRFNNPQDSAQDDPVKCVITLNNGTRLRLVGLDFESNAVLGRISAKSSSIKLLIEDIREIVFLSGEFSYVSDLKSKETTPEGKVGIDRSVDGYFLRVGEWRFEKGIATTDGICVGYEIDMNAKTLVGMIGLYESAVEEIFLDNNTSDYGGLGKETEKWRFRVFVDEKCVFEEDSMVCDGQAKIFSLKIENGKRLEFLAESNRPESKHQAVWAELRIQ